MKVVPVIKIEAVAIPDEGTPEYLRLWDSWWDAVGRHLAENDAPVPTEGELIRSLAVHVSVENARGNLTEFVDKENWVVKL